MTDLSQWFDELKQRIGEEIGVTDWFVVTQREADLFATLTDDWDVMHNDPAWAGPRFGGTIAHGLYVLSLLPSFSKQVSPNSPIVSTTTDSVLNYGYNKVRFISPLRIGQRARDRITLLDIEEKRPGDFLIVSRHTIEKEGEDRPFMVADACGYYVTGYDEKWTAER